MSMLVPLEIIDIILSVSSIVDLKPWFLVSKYCQHRVLVELKCRFPLQIPHILMKFCFFPLIQDDNYLDRIHSNAFIIERPSTSHINIWSKQHKCFTFMAKFDYPVTILRLERGYVAILTLSDQFMFGSIYVIRAYSAEVITHTISPLLMVQMIANNHNGVYTKLLSPTGDFMYQFGNKRISTNSPSTSYRYLSLPPGKYHEDFEDISTLHNHFYWENDTTIAIHKNEFDDSVARTFQVGGDPSSFKRTLITNFK